MIYNSVDVCFDIANKLKDPYSIKSHVYDQINKDLFYSSIWPEMSLEFGIPGIICFYAMMDLNFENNGWNKVIYEYFKYIKNNIDYHTLYSNILGISFATFIASDNGSRYKNFLSKLDEILIKKIKTEFLNNIDKYLDQNTSVPSNFYNLMHGLSGIITYLIHRDDNCDLTSLLYECIESIVKVLSMSKNVGSKELFAWFEPKLSNIEKKHYKLDIPYGIPGVLAALSLAKQKGIKIEGLSQLITKIAKWIVDKHVIHNGRVNWNRIYLIDDDHHLDIYEDVWLYGAFSISRCLYLASNAIDDLELKKFAEEVFISHLRQCPEKNNTPDTSFCFGKAGLLILAYNMACDTQKVELFQILKAMEQDLIQDFNPLHKYGFQTLCFNKKNLQWIDNPDLFSGAIGIALSLLSIQSNKQMIWKMRFAI